MDWQQFVCMCPSAGKMQPNVCKSEKIEWHWWFGDTCTVCASGRAQHTAGWRCGHRPHSFCDVLWHTDGSWHNTDSNSLVLSHPLSLLLLLLLLSKMDVLSPVRFMCLYLLSDLIDIQINAKNINTALLFCFFIFLLNLPQPPPSPTTFPFFTPFLVSSSFTHWYCTGVSEAFWMRYYSSKCAKKQEVTVEWFQMNIHSPYQQLPLSKQPTCTVQMRSSIWFKMKVQ